MIKQTTIASATTALFAALALTACSKPIDVHTARSDSDTAVVQGTPSAGDQATKDIDRAKQATRQAASDLKSATTNAADQATDKVADALITTSINAELAKDASLSATHIDVDTNGGRVALHGTAPDEASKQRATDLARNVKGVVTVDNQLNVRGNG